MGRGECDEHAGGEADLEMARAWSQPHRESSCADDEGKPHQQQSEGNRPEARAEARGVMNRAERPRGPFTARGDEPCAEENDGRPSPRDGEIFLGGEREVDIRRREHEPRGVE